MTTKGQERTALAKIRKIVAELGENSYIGSAFDGAFLLAEQNIEDDAAYTTRYYIDRVRELEAETKAMNSNVRIRSLKRDLKTTCHALDCANESIRKLENSCTGLNGTIDCLKDVLDQRDAEILRFKAKLYDLMTAE